MRHITVVFILCYALFPVLLSGCAMYSYKNNGCELSIWSMREIKAGDIRITKQCTLTGGAAGMTYNEKQMEIFQTLVNKIP